MALRLTIFSYIRKISGGGDFILTPRRRLRTLDSVEPIFSGDPGDLVSQKEKKSLDPGDPRSWFSGVGLDIAELGFCTAIMPLYLEEPLDEITFVFGSPKSLFSLYSSICVEFQLRID